MEDLAELATNLSAIEDWLRDHCTARHNEDMADTVHEAWRIVENIIDAEIFCAVCRKSLLHHNGMQVWLCHRIISDRLNS